MSSEPGNFINVMETFVLEEIKLQLEKSEIHSQMANYIKISEAATFALNRLPSYYASCLEGREKQKNRIRSDRQLVYKIREVVNHALLTVERDPLRQSTPIVQKDQELFQDPFTAAKEIVPNFDNSLPKEELQWIVSFMETFLTNVRNKQVSQREIIQLYYLLYYYWQDNP